MSRYCQHMAQPGPGSTETVRVKPDLVLPRNLSAVIQPRSTDPYGLAFAASWDDASLKYEITRLEIDRNAAPITSLGLRAIAVQEEFELVAAFDARLENGELFSLPLHPSDVPREQRELWAARAYAMARAVNRAPLQQVAQALGVSQSTATRLVARARAEGLLD